ncbi:MAG: signal peptidase I [Planctomycetes bacterium RBG_13_63_9]|nr:MAG: signal peptidase I [Planctomycetes bacterium RBG_13_63_9]
MFSTIVIVSLFLGVSVAQILLWAVFLRWGLRWAKVEHVTMRRVMLVTVLAFIFHNGLAVLSLSLSPTNPALALLFGLAQLAAAVLILCLLIMVFFKAGFLRSLQAWLPTLIPQLGMTLVLILVIQPFLVEAFVTPTNAMAPTLLGRHCRGQCPECGAPAFCSPPDPQWNTSINAPWMICRHCFHTWQTSDLDERILGGDRFCVAKFLKPRRWDVIVFRYPEDPSVLYVMRLVGLPGEEIHIDGGAVWANGRKLTPPESIRGLKYASEIPLLPTKLSGTPDNPAILGQDEYFVLGDFSLRAKDSRLWSQGAPGHAPFAVPESHLVGVVTHIYWPPQRSRILR